MTSRPERYEIREKETSELIKSLYPEMAHVLYAVWDTRLDKRVPFGNYRTPEDAQDRINRLKARDGAVKDT